MDPIAATSLAVSAVALAASLYAAVRSNINTSAATLISFNTAFGEGWRNFGRATDDTRDFEFGQLVNLLEIACALYLDRAIHGRSRELLRMLLWECLCLLEGSEWCREKMAGFRNRKTTFRNIVRFLADCRRCGFAHPLEDVARP